MELHLSYDDRYHFSSPVTKISDPAVLTLTSASDAVAAGIESEIDTTPVLSGVTDLETVKEFPYRPTYIMNGVCDFTENA